MKNKILLTITAIMAIIFLISLCCVDSDTYLFYFAALGSGAWLALFAYANGLIGKVEW